MSSLDKGDPVHPSWPRRDETGQTDLGKGGAPKVVGKLLTQGLIEEIPAPGALPIWRRDEENGAVALRITRRGLAAIRIDEHRAFLEKAGAEARWRRYSTMELRAIAMARPSYAPFLGGVVAQEPRNA